MDAVAATAQSSSGAEGAGGLLGQQSAGGISGAAAAAGAGEHSRRRPWRGWALRGVASAALVVGVVLAVTLSRKGARAGGAGGDVAPASKGFVPSAVDTAVVPTTGAAAAAAAGTGAGAGAVVLPSATGTAATLAPSRAAGKQEQAPQSNLEKLLDQLGGSSSGASSSSGSSAMDAAMEQAAAGSSEAAKQLALSYVEVAGCTPADGKDLARMVEETSCPIITLKPRFNYSVETNIVVRRRVTIVGRPLGMPVIDAHNATRAFLVEPTGALDVRFCRIIKGTFIEVIPLVEYHMRGPTAYVRAGGSLDLLGCEVTVDPLLALRAVGFTPPQTNLRIFGGGVTAEGGVVRATDCDFYSAYPGFIARESQFIGGDFLNVAGTIYLTGCRFLQVTMFANAIGGGGYVANLGGNIVITGCLFGYASGFVSLSGLGFLFFNGGGTMIVTGSEVATNIAVAGFFGGGIGMFTGGGVGITTGFIYSDVGALGTGIGLGFQQAVGGGVLVRTGVIQSSMGALGFAAGVGINMYVGGGVSVINSMIQTRASAISSFYGSAINIFVGNGVCTVAQTLGGFSQGIGASAFAGGDIAVMTGWLTRASQLYGNAAAISFAVGQGADVFVGPGGAALALNAYMYAPSAIAYVNPGLALIYVNGNNVISLNRVGKAVVAFKLVALKRGVMDYHNNFFIARELSWIIARQLQGGLVPARRQKERVRALLPAHDAHDADTASAAAAAKGPQGFANYNHLPIDEALARFRHARRGLPVVPTPRGALTPTRPVRERRGRRLGEEDAATVAVPLASHDVQALLSEANKALADGSLASAAGAEQQVGVTVAAPPAVDADVVAAATAAAAVEVVNKTGNPWFYFAEHPALQVEGTPKTNKVYLASRTMQGCAVCGLRSDEGAATADNLDGPGAGGCRVDESCKAEAEAGAGGAAQGALDGQPEFARMWVTEGGAPLPNSTVATVYLKAALTPGRQKQQPGEEEEFTTVSSEQVAAALSATIRALGLPTRFHLRVEKAMTEESIDPAFKGPDVPEYMKEGTGPPARRRLRAMRAAQRRRLQQEMGNGEVGGQQECGRSELFKAYVVSDWKNVTDAVARDVRAAEAEGLLTRLLQERADADAAEGRSPLVFADLDTWGLADDGASGAAESATAAAATPPAVCTLVAYRTASIHVPASRIAGVSNGTPLPTRYTLPGADGSIFAAGHADDADDEDAGLDPLSRLLLQAAPSIAVVLPPSPEEAAAAAAVEEEAARRRARRRRGLQQQDGAGAEEAVSGIRELPPRAQEVTPGGTLTVLLQGFNPGQLLSLRLVPEVGEDILLPAPVLSAPAAFSRRQLWSGKLPASVPPGQYFLEATSQRKDAFAYSQAFTVLPLAGAGA